MAYGTIKVDTVTFTSEGIDTSVSISGLVRNPTFSGNITSTSTISGVTIQGGTLVSGATVTGSAGQFTTITGGTVNFTTITGTTAVITSGVFASGTAAAPSVSIGTTTNGIYSPGANQVAITTSGTGRLFVTSDGKVGIGTGSPSQQLTSVVSSAGIAFRGSHNNTGLDLYANDATGEARITAARLGGSGGKFLSLYTDTGSGEFERVRITADGKVGIGTVSPLASAKLDVTGGAVVCDRYFHNRIPSTLAVAERGLLFNIDGTDYGRIYSPNGKSVAIQAGDGTLTDAVTVDQLGKVGIGTNSPGYLLDVQGTARIGPPTGDAAIEVGNNATANRNAYIDFVGDTTYTDYGLRLIRDNSGPNAFSALRHRGTGSLTLLTEEVAPITFEVNLSERVRIDSSGRLLVGTSTTNNNIRLGQNLAVVKTGGGGSGYGGIGVTSYAGTTSYVAPTLELNRSRGTTDGSMTIVASDDTLGYVGFRGADGTSFVDSVTIRAEVDGTPGANNMPGRLVFATTADGVPGPTERARITSGGYFKASNDGNYTSTSGAYHELYQTADAPVLWARATNSSLVNALYYATAARSANAAYYFFVGTSGYGGTADDEFKLYGDGNGKCDGAWTGGGADYAEYFEWSDSNPTAEDRRGISVVLDGDKIREAQAGEDPIGVISGNPSMVGDAAWNKWSGKYLRDDYGTYLLDANGDRQLNPAYDPDAEYIPREQRPEWDCVGLMGKLRIRKGQVTGSRWIKMRDISATVEEWLVR